MAQEKKNRPEGNTGKATLPVLSNTEAKLKALLKLEKITQDDVDTLSRSEKDILGEITAQKLNELKGIERDVFVEKIESILPLSTKNQLWESNHAVITAAISNLMQEYNCMPAMNNIAKETGLSRQTIHKHMKEYYNHPRYLAEKDQFKFMTSKVLAKVFKFAVNGDMRAAKLYFEMVGALGNQQQPGTVINEQNNYIQINNTVLNQETIKLLSAEQLNQIEEIIKIALPGGAKK